MIQLQYRLKTHPHYYGEQMEKKKRIIDGVDYSHWIRHQSDVDFDFKWHIFQVIAALFALIGSFFFIIHIFFL